MSWLLWERPGRLYSRTLRLSYPETNAALAHTTFGVAENSQHLYGRERDIHLGSRLTDAAMMGGRRRLVSAFRLHPHDTAPGRNWTFEEAGLGALLNGEPVNRKDNGSSWSALIGAQPASASCPAALHPASHSITRGCNRSRDPNSSPACGEFLVRARGRHLASASPRSRARRYQCAAILVSPRTP
jgi:hypothetical protein